MKLLVIGLSFLVIGVIMNALGWEFHRRGSHTTRGADDSELTKWILEVLREWYPLLTGQTSDIGQRLAALGALIAALGVLGIVIALFSLAI